MRPATGVAGEGRNAVSPVLAAPSPARGAARSSRPLRAPGPLRARHGGLVPRERWSAAVASLRSVLAHTPAGVAIVHVDGGCPPQTRRRLARMLADRPRVTHLREAAYLAPNRSRNLATARASTPYVAFVDNDVLVARGWLDALVACAEETGAWAVGPLCLQGPWRAGEIHLAGGDARIEGGDDSRHLVERQELLGARVADVRASLARRRTELAEFHAILVRRTALDAIGGLDEELRSFGEHTDFCLRAREEGGAIWFEPASVVTYLQPTRLTRADLPFFVARWSTAWNRSSRDRFAARWHLPSTDARLVHTLDFAEDHRRRWLRAVVARPPPREGAAAGPAPIAGPARSPHGSSRGPAASARRGSARVRSRRAASRRPIRQPRRAPPPRRCGGSSAPRRARSSTLALRTAPCARPTS